jgi:hypothetical protein
MYFLRLDGPAFLDEVIPEPLLSTESRAIPLVMWRGLSRLTDIELGFTLAARLMGN